MTSIITGDIIGSRQQESEHWVEDLKDFSPVWIHAGTMGSISR